MAKIRNSNTSSSSSWGDVRDTNRPSRKNSRISDSMNVSYGKVRKNTIPELSLDAQQDTPLYKQANEEYKNREVLPNYIKSNPNDNG